MMTETTTTVGCTLKKQNIRTAHVGSTQKCDIFILQSGSVFPAFLAPLHPCLSLFKLTPINALKSCFHLRHVGKTLSLSKQKLQSNHFISRLCLEYFNSSLHIGNLSLDSSPLQLVMCIFSHTAHTDGVVTQIKLNLLKTSARL